MDIIYRCAEAVILDVGEADEETPLLLHNLHYFSYHPLHFWEQILERPGDQHEYKSVLETTLIPGAKGSFWPSFLRFIRRPWWQRVWMFQEYVFARDLLVLFGDRLYTESFISHHLVSACEVFWKLVSYGNKFNQGGMGLDEFVKDIQTAYRAIKIRLEVRQLHQSPLLGRLDLATLLSMTQALKATNPLDRVYALISVTRPTGPGTIRDFPVLYTESTAETAFRLSLFMLEPEQNPLYLLYECVGVDSSQASWSLSLEQKENNKLQNAWTRDELFKAGGDSSLSVTLKRADSSLLTKGVVIGEIVHTGPEWQLPDVISSNDPSRLADIYALLGKSHSWVIDQTSSISHEYTLEDFSRTLIADLTMRNQETYRSHDSPEFSDSLTAYAELTTFFSRVTDISRTYEQLAKLNEMVNRARLFIGSVQISAGRRVAVLESGRPCLVTENTNAGDIVFIPTGAPVPLILWPLTDNSFGIVGCCYVHLMMDGQVFEHENEPPGITEAIIR